MTELNMALERLRRCTKVSHWDTETAEGYFNYFRNNSTVHRINQICDAEENDPQARL